MQELVEEMRTIRVEVVVEKGSVLDLATIQRIQQAAAERPIRGVVQGAMVLQVSAETTRDNSQH
jgi:hypothetical protein